MRRRAKADGSANLTVRDYRDSIYAARINRRELTTLRHLMRAIREATADTTPGCYRTISITLSPREQKHCKHFESVFANALIHGEQKRVK